MTLCESCFAAYDGSIVKSEVMVAALSRAGAVLKFVSACNNNLSGDSLITIKALKSITETVSKAGLVISLKNFSMSMLATNFTNIVTSVALSCYAISVCLISTVALAFPRVRRVWHSP